MTTKKGAVWAPSSLQIHLKLVVLLVVVLAVRRVRRIGRAVLLAVLAVLVGFVLLILIVLVVLIIILRHFCFLLNFHLGYRSIIFFFHPFYTFVL